MDLGECFEKQRTLLVDRLDPDFGLLDELLSTGALSRPEVSRIRSVQDSYGRSEKLLELVFKRTCFQQFLEALRSTQQNHLANFVLANGEQRPDFGDDWPLSGKDVKVLDVNQRFLVDKLDTCDLLPLLYSRGVLNNRQRDLISSKQTSFEKNETLLELVRRCSLRSFHRFIDCLHSSRQRHIAELLMNGRVAVKIHCDLEAERVDEVEKELVTRFVEMLGDRPLSDSARILEATQLRLIAARRASSIVLYIFCRNLKELLHLQKIQASGKLNTSLKVTFNRLLSREQVAAVTATLSEDVYNMCHEFLSDFDPHIHRPFGGAFDAKEKVLSNTSLSEIPLELLDVILRKSLLRMVENEAENRPRNVEFIVNKMASVDVCWCQRITRRRFKKTFWRHHLVSMKALSKRLTLQRNVYSYLAESVYGKSLTTQLLSADCLTDLEARQIVARRQLRGPRISLTRNEELFHLMKSIDRNDDSGWTEFVQCLRQSRQKEAARVAAEGGVPVKVEIRNQDLGARMFIVLRDFLDRTKPKPTNLEHLFHRLRDDSIELLHSVYDRQQPVVWFLCLSNSSLQRLRKLMERPVPFQVLAASLKIPSQEGMSELFGVKSANVESDQLKREIVFFPEPPLEFRARLRLLESVRLRGITKAGDQIHVVCHDHSSNQSSILVFEDQPPFQLQTKTPIEEIKEPEDIVFSEAERSFYVTDSSDRCVWKMDENHRSVTRWISDVVEPFTLSLSCRGELLVARKGQTFSTIEVFESNGKLHHSYHLPLDIQNVQHVVETSAGSFVILHRSNPIAPSRQRKWYVTELTRGQPKVIRQFIPKDSTHQLNDPSHLALDLDDQVFVADTWNYQVVQLDSDFQWRRIFTAETSVTEGEKRNQLWSVRLYYDIRRKQLLVGGLGSIDFYASMTLPRLGHAPEN